MMKDTNLHSTMLLLYPGCVIISLQAFVDLHSTMLLLYLARAFTFAHPLANLHSTMLLLYREALAIPAQSFQIYIPLCFYYITIYKYT